MNTFGRLFRVSLYGESHNKSVGVLIDGVRPGIKLSEEDFLEDLAKRKSGGLGTTPRIEADLPIIEGGVFNGYTTGAPLMIRFLNENTNSKDYSSLINKPRPSHADFVAKEKYHGYNDYRGGGHFSGRLTLGIVAAGVVAKKMLEGVKIASEIINLGGETDPLKFDEVLKSLKDDSVGGIVKIVVENPPLSLGEPYFDSVEGVISHILYSIGGVKGVEFGAGFSAASLKGSEFNDSIIDKRGKTSTNNNGGINGGITNGNSIVIKVFIKPTPSISKPQMSINLESNMLEELKIEGRHDKAIILRARPALEAAVMIALCDLYLINKSIYN